MAKPLLPDDLWEIVRPLLPVVEPRPPGAPGMAVIKAGADLRTRCRSLVRTRAPTSASTVSPGQRAWIADSVAAQCAAPPSSRSSRSTQVITVWRRSSAASISATRRGSSASGGSGRPVGTSQKRQLRVQMPPRIMIVSARRLQHSPMLGQEALSQTVCSSSLCTISRRSKYTSPDGIFALIQGGWRGRGLSGEEGAGACFSASTRRRRLRVSTASGIGVCGSTTGSG